MDNKNSLYKKLNGMISNNESFLSSEKILTQYVDVIGKTKGRYILIFLYPFLVLYMLAAILYEIVLVVWDSAHQNFSAEAILNLLTITLYFGFQYSFLYYVHGWLKYVPILKIYKKGILLRSSTFNGFRFNKDTVFIQYQNIHELEPIVNLESVGYFIIDIHGRKYKIDGPMAEQISIDLIRKYIHQYKQSTNDHLLAPPRAENGISSPSQ